MSRNTKNQESGIAAVSMVKNEADIIELFVRINSRIFDKIYILDHNSDDATPKILKLLQAEGYALQVISLSGESPAYSQAEITTRYVREIARTGLHEFIMPLDADEFLASCPDVDLAKVLRKHLPLGGLGEVPWKTYCPSQGGYYECGSPLYQNFLPRNREPCAYVKLVLRSDIASICELDMGNHSLIHPCGHKPIRLPLVLQHVPVRTPEQIASKACIGSMALALNSARKPGQGHHWNAIALRAVSKGMLLDDGDALDIALNYASWKSYPWYKFWRRPRLLSHDSSPRIGSEADQILHKEHARVCFRDNIRSFISSLTFEQREIVASMPVLGPKFLAY